MTRKNTGPIQRSSSRTREIIWNFELRTTSCCWYPCALLGIDEAVTVYMILVYSKSLQEHKVIRKLRGVPRSAILYSDHDPYNLNQTIPDSILPLRWRTDYNSATQLQLGTSDNKCWSWRWMELRTTWRVRKNLVPQNVQIPLVLYEAANQNFFVTCLKLTRAEKINSLFLFKNSIIDVPLVGRLILLDNHWKHVLLALNKRIQ